MFAPASRIPAVLALALVASCGGDAPEAWIEVQRLSGSRTELVLARCRTRGLEEPIVYTWKTGASLRQYTSMPRDGSALLIDVMNPTSTGIDCSAGPPGHLVSAWTSLAPVVIRSVSALAAGKPAPADAGVAAGTALAVEGTGFGVQPRADDGIYFARARGRTLIANHSCPGAVWTDTRIVACVPPGVTPGLWQVRVQAGGRLGLLDTRAGAVDQMKSVALGMVLCAVFVLSAPREPAGGEVAAHRASARALVAHCSWDIGSEPIDSAASVHLGRRYAVAAPGGALALVPAELLARAGLPARAVQLAESATAALLAAILCALFFSSLLQKNLSPRVALVATLLLALCTPLWVHARLADGTTLAALLLFIAVHAALRGGALVCGLASGALALVDPIYILPAVVLAAYSAGRGGNLRRLLMAALPLALGLTAALWHRRLIGARPEPSGDLIEGVVGLLLSTGKSIFLFAPPLALLAFAARPWWRERRAEAALTLVVIASVVLGAARLPSWHGDPGWGPRRILPLLPLLMEPVAFYLSHAWVHRLRTALLVTVLALAGFGVQLLGLSFSLSTWPRMVAALRQQTGAPGWFSDPRSDTHFIPQFSPISGHAWLLRHYLNGNKNLGEDAPFRLVVPNTPKLDGEYGKLQLDWWLLPPRVVR